MGYKYNFEQFNDILAKLNEIYTLVGPKIFYNKGRYSGQNLISYGEIHSIEEIVFDEKTEYSAKEFIVPITQQLLKFKDGKNLFDDKPFSPQIIFLRPCDINAVKRLDCIFLQNGGIEDFYYKQIRENIKFAMIECRESFENCFCVSMNANYTDDFSFAIRKNENNVYITLRDQSLSDFFPFKEEIDFIPEYVKENKVSFSEPNIVYMPVTMFSDNIWREYDSRCIACGKCTLVCPTCSCFTTYDVKNDDGTSERNRVWASCHIKGFTDIAGGHSFRLSNGDRMRFKTFHKIYDFKKRFNINMCIGCGRCDDSCPQYISFSECIKKTLKKIEEVKKDE